ncbi:hypothetical protein BKA70DRAFT_1290921 [Coprinopsis sp. MPI-PUGE-AT-0042]|nr:hypothetical protein BKA70DRAFT_1290921 [Coprinopsis sp. MPI-PUGE-AT-0042]
MSTLPTEIIFEIFSDHQDTEVLKTASLVCKVLQHHAQSLFFRSYKMNTGLKSGGRRWLDGNLEAVVAILKLLSIQQITGLVLSGRGLVLALRSPERKYHEELATLVFNLCGGPNLRTLTLSEQNVDLLPLCGPSVKELNAILVQGMNHSAIPFTTRKTPIVLEVLSITKIACDRAEDISIIDFVLHPSSTISLDSLKTLAISVNSRSLGAVRAILNCSRESLCRLDLYFEYTNDRDYHSLRSTTVPAQLPNNQETDIVSWVYSDLKVALKSPLPLERLSIQFDVDSPGCAVLNDALTAQWSPFVSLLANEKALPKLQWFKLSFRGMFGDCLGVRREIGKIFQYLGEPAYSLAVDRRRWPTRRFTWSMVNGNSVMRSGGGMETGSG